MQNDISIPKREYGDNVVPERVVSDLYKKAYGESPIVESISGASSNRKYFRLHSSIGKAVVGTWGQDIEENRTFVNLSHAFSDCGIKVPEIYAVNEYLTAYLQQDLGDSNLLSFLDGPRRIELSSLCLEKLVEMQTLNEKVWNHYVGVPGFCIRQVLWDLNYFKYDFLKPAGIAFDENALQDDFEMFAGRLTDIPNNFNGFMYRDFQSRNVMVKDDELWFIDFQGGRKGPAVYDAVSFLWQSKAKFSNDERQMLLDKYVSAFSEKRDIDKESLFNLVPAFAAFRTLQVIGAYGFRGIIEKKSHFIESLPGALDNLRYLYEKGAFAPYHELSRVCRRCFESRFAGASDAYDGLEINIISFSYKRGSYPEDFTGNGGGFMFDCRGMHNPGRYEEYKSLTGLDKPVKDFLEQRGEVQKFLANCLSLVNPTVERYVDRGFRHLQIGFGCTGGQHRSVYCAEAMASKLKELYPEVKIVLTHRERGIEKSLV